MVSSQILYVKTADAVFCGRRGGAARFPLRLRHNLYHGVAQHNVAQLIALLQHQTHGARLALAGVRLHDGVLQARVKLFARAVDHRYATLFQRFAQLAMHHADALVQGGVGAFGRHPPGIAMILCGSLANVSIGKLFVSGIGVGILLCVGEMVTVSVISKKRGYAPTRDHRLTWKEAAPVVKDSILPMCLPVIIIGGVRLGIFTATEAGAVAVVYSIVLGLIYRELDWATIKNGLKETILSTGGIMLIIGAASALSWILTKERIPQMLTEAMLEVSANKYVFLLLVNLFLLIVGMFIEGNAAMIILVPLLFPIAMNYGINEIQFLMVFIFNMAIGSMSPPMGTLMFVVCGETKCKLKDFIIESIPFYIVLIVELLALTFIPFLTTGLVDLIY